MKILQNAIKCPDGTILVSTYRHDFQYYTQEDGRSYGVDGGVEYGRTLFSDQEFEDLSLHEDSPFEEQVNKALWGTYGKYGDEPLKWVFVKDMDNEHLKSCLRKDFRSNLPTWMADVMNHVYSIREAQYNGQ